MKIMQGDAYPIYFQLTGADDEPLSPEEIEKVEIMIGSVLKVYPCEDIQYDAEEQCFVMTLRQRDTLSLHPGTQAMQFRVKGKDGTVVGWRAGTKFGVVRSDSKEVL